MDEFVCRSSLQDGRFAVGCGISSTLFAVPERHHLVYRLLDCALIDAVLTGCIRERVALCMGVEADDRPIHPCQANTLVQIRSYVDYAGELGA